MFFTKDIYFKCPCCRKALVVERSAAGREAPCPACSANVRIPTRSRLPPRVVRFGSMVALNAAVALATVAVLAHREPAKLDLPPPRKMSALEHALREKSAEQPPALPFGAAKATGTAADELRRKNAELEKRNLQLSTQFDGIAQWVMDNYQGKYPLPLTLVGRLKIPPVNPDFTLGGDLANFLKVTPAEQAVLNEKLAAARDAMAKTEASLISVTAQNDNSVTLYVPPYERQGGAIRGDLYGTMESTLGAPRFDKFVNVSDQGLNEAYHYFGTAAREMQIEVVPQQGGDAPYLLIKDGWQIPEGDSATRYTGKQSATREIPPEYSTYMNLMPPNIAAFPVKQNGG